VTLDRLAAIVGREHVLAPPPQAYLADATSMRGLRGAADAVVRPGSAAEVAQVVAACCAEGTAITVRGGGTGFAGGAVPGGGVILALERLARVRSLDPLRWRMEVEAGATTAEVRRLARGAGLWFPPDPGAAEQSQIGGNVATDAGGPHAFKYGTTGAWVTGVEAVIAPGDVVTAGGPLRKDVAGYDLRRLLVGSEGTLGVITAVWLRLVPAVESALPVVASFADVASGCAGIEALMGSGVVPACIEYLDAGTMAIAGRGVPAGVPASGFVVIAEADGTDREARAGRTVLAEALRGEGAADVATPEGREAAALWRWRDGVSPAVAAHRGEKLSEDVAVPLDRLAEAIEGTAAIGTRHDVEALSWGHAGDGNLHSSFLVPAGDAAAHARAEAACADLFTLALSLGGTITGEHGVGRVKRDHLAARVGPAGMRLNEGVKRLFDPQGIFNPGRVVG
jgi:FAD/FMN-containing dehydrogenase